MKMKLEENNTTFILTNLTFHIFTLRFSVFR